MSNFSEEKDSIKSDLFDDEIDSGEKESPSEEKIDQYFIDEDYLKDLESNMTENDKVAKHDEALAKKNEGNIKFKEGIYEDAATIYTEGLKLCPVAFEKDRAILYSNRAAARSKLSEEQKKEAIKDCDKAVNLDPFYLKAIQRRAKLHKELDNLDEALRDYKKVLEIEPGNAEAISAVRFLPEQIEEKNEKLKAEMMGKLKDLGNMILKPFGLSTDNFKFEKNPDSGGYSVNFNQ